MAKEKAADHERLAGLREKYVELSTLDSNLKQMQQQLEYFDQQFGEILTISADLEELRSCRPGSGLLVPVHQGIFLRATLENTDELLVNVGNNVAVPKKLDDAISMVAGQLGDMQEMREKIAKEMERLMSKAEQLQKEALGTQEAQ